jgi:hypothetical protein
LQQVDLMRAGIVPEGAMPRNEARGRDHADKRCALQLRDVYDKLVEQFATATETTPCEQSAMALRYTSITFGQLGRREEKISSYDDRVETFADAIQVRRSRAIPGSACQKGLTLDPLLFVRNKIDTQLNVVA